MIAEVGLICLIIAFAFAISLVFIVGLGIVLNNPSWQRAGFAFVNVQLLFLFFSFIALISCFVLDKFEVLYVVSNSSRELPLIYKICAVWGGHEGSILLWAVLLSFWIFAVSYGCKSIPFEFLIRTVFVLTAILAGFLWFILSTSNPFLIDFGYENHVGRDLNPLLQDPGFLLHPPLLYMGYVGFSVGFALAIVALWLGKVESNWPQWSRPWTLGAWSFLTLGITLGSWWAYRELGWGGWWFWDPVENASFMPWLIGTALIHSLVVTQKRKQFYLSTLLLSIIAFSMSLVGTFLVRSGVLTSVHAFAVDPARGLYILLFLAIVVGGALLLFALRAPQFKIQGQFKLCARESFILLNNLFMTVCMLTVLLGTLYPLIIDALQLGKLSVGAPYFNFVLIPLFMPVLFLMGAAVEAKWQNESFWALVSRMKFAFGFSSFLALSIYLYFFSYQMIRVTLGVFLSIWVITNTLIQIYKKIKDKSLQGLSSAFIGMCFAHLGIALVVLGIALSSGLGLQKDVHLALGEHVKFGAYQLTYLKQTPKNGPNYNAIVAEFRIEKPGYTKSIYPEKRYYIKSDMPMTDAAIDVTPLRDIYVAMGEPMGEGEWSFRLYYKPFIRFIWLGGGVIFLGGLIALFKRQHFQSQQRDYTLSKEAA